MSVQSIYRWRDGRLDPLEYCDMTATTIFAADSWLVSDGLTLGLALHHDRFVAAAQQSDTVTAAEIDTFWDAAVASIPVSDDWFPRVELHSTGRLILRLRSAPQRNRSAVLATFGGADPRTTPRTKGPDLERMLAARTSVQAEGADEAVLLSDGFVVEGAYSGLLWWRGEILCGPPADFDRANQRAEARAWR